MFTHFVFDVDGTLIDTEKVILNSLIRVLKDDLKKDYNYSELVDLFGMPGKSILKRFGVKDVELCGIKWNKYIKESYERVKVFNGIEEVLSKLYKDGFTLGIITSKTKDEYNEQFCGFSISKFFKTMVFVDDTINHKPDPEPILMFLKKSMAKVSETIYIGDTIYDSVSAQKANVAFGLALWGASKDNIQANFKFINPQDILKIPILKVP